MIPLRKINRAKADTRQMVGIGNKTALNTVFIVGIDDVIEGERSGRK